MGLRGLDGVWDRSRRGPARSRRALWEALGLLLAMTRGVKKRLNFLGVMDGFRRSLAELRGGGEDGIGGILLLVFNDDELLTPKGVEALLGLSAMAKEFSYATR